MNFNSEDSHQNERDENSQTRDGQLMEIMEQTVARWDQEHLNSRSNLSEKPSRTEKRLVLWPDFHNIFKTLMQEAMDKLDN